ncbi:MAG: LapA family protein [Planctomycetota bacterium]|nr:LapA family protein [Planctomycetota bacterium]
MARVKLFAALALIAMVLVVILQNRQPVETKILFMTIVMPRAALLAITMLIGVGVGMLVSLGITSKANKKA